jgi:hypothetical protein
LYGIASCPFSQGSERRKMISAEVRMNDYQDSLPEIPETAVPTHNKSYNLDNNRGNPRVSGDVREIVLEALFQDTRIETKNIKIIDLGNQDIELVGTVPDEKMIRFINEDIRLLGHENFINNLTVSQ